MLMPIFDQFFFYVPANKGDNKGKKGKRGGSGKSNDGRGSVCYTVFLLIVLYRSNSCLAVSAAKL